MDARTRVHRRLVELGWVATRRQLLAVAPRSTVDAMLADGTLHAVARGRYALPLDQPARVTAHRLAGVAAYQTAAQHWGIPMKWPPPKPQVVVPRGRRVAQQVQAEIAISWRALPPHDVVDGWVTTPLRTVLDCAATLPFDEALAIADSAMRTGRVTGTAMRTAAGEAPARGRERITCVAEHADGRAAGPFESVVRAIALAVPGLRVVPQVRIHSNGRFVAQVDLADERLRIVIEADSFEFHGDRQLFDRDCRRYDELVADGWLVLRFSWEQVMTRPEWVRQMLVAAVAQRS